VACLAVAYGFCALPACCRDWRTNSPLPFYGVNVPRVSLFWSELPAGECRAGRRLRAHPGPPRRSRRSIPPRTGGVGDGAVTGTMPHRPSQRALRNNP
jgi:hypothetical protein